MSMRLGFGIGAPYALATPIPGSPYILPFYNDPTYGVVLYPYNAFNPATVQLYKIVADADRPTGMRVDLIGAPIAFPTRSLSGPGSIDGNEQILPLENHIVFTEFMTADAAGKPGDFSAWGVGVLTRSGESISFNFPAGQVKSLATDGMFNHGDRHWMVRVGTDALARGYGLSLGDGTVFSTGNFGSVVDGITIAGSGAASLASHTVINNPPNPSWNLQGATPVQNPGEFAMILGYDGSRLFGVKDYVIPTPGPFSYPWTLGGGASGAGKALIASTAPWSGSNRPNNHGPGFPWIEGTALGVLQAIGTTQGVCAYSDGASVACASPTVSGWPLMDDDPMFPGYFQPTWGGGTILAQPSFGDYATFKSYQTAAPDFVIRYGRTSQSGLSFSAVAEANTAISTATYGWGSATVLAAGRHTSGIAVLGLFIPDPFPDGQYFLEAVPI